MNSKGEIRIIAGEYRGRRIKVAARPGLRPTPDRVRETLFNWLGQWLDGLACLDLFAGSGALGFEALSRGAARAVMVESDRAVAQALRENVKALEAEGAEIVQGDAMAYLGDGGGKFDVAFVDAPYASDLARRAMDRLPPRLKPGARVYVESAQPLDLGAPWAALREDRAGAVRYALYEMNP